MRMTWQVIGSWLTSVTMTHSELLSSPGHIVMHWLSELDGRLIGYRCTCGGSWKIYQKEHHDQLSFDDAQ